MDKQTRWTVKTTKEIEVNLITIPPNTVLEVKDKFPDKNGDVEKGFWQIKDGYGTLFSMSYEDRCNCMEIL